MDAIDILGGLLGQKSGLGGQILKSIVTGGKSSQSEAPESLPVPRMPAGRPRIVEAPSEPSQPQLDSLEDMLRQAHSRGSSATAQSAPYQQTTSPASRQPKPQQPARREQAPASGSLFPQNQPTADQSSPLNQKDELLVQAMINAAKADGQIDQTEQDKIVQQMGQLTQKDVDYLRREFAKPLNLRDFVWSVPPGAEQEIYAISMLVLNLDSVAETNYLKDLAHGLRLPPGLCAQIHQRFGVPVA